MSACRLTPILYTLEDHLLSAVRSSSSPEAVASVRHVETHHVVVTRVLRITDCQSLVCIPTKTNTGLIYIGNKSCLFLIVCWRHWSLFPVISDFKLPVSLLEARQTQRRTEGFLIIFVDFNLSSGMQTNNQIYFVFVSRNALYIVTSLM